MAADTLLLTEGLAGISADNLLLTPPGGAQNTLANLVNGGTVDAATGLLNFASITPAGTAQANAALITGRTTQLGTAASTTGAVFPAAPGLTIGEPLLLLNSGTAAVHIYGNGYTIDTIAGTTGVILTNGTACFFTPTGTATIVSGPKGAVSA